MGHTYTHASCGVSCFAELAKEIDPSFGKLKQGEIKVVRAPWGGHTLADD